MKIDPPSWEHATERCPYCAQQGELIFSRCPTPNCATIVLICAECGTVYTISDKKRGIEAGDTSGATRCHLCSGTFHHDFPPASSDEIQNLGFTIDDYR